MNNKQLKIIKNYISKHEGATLTANGLGFALLKRGYMVSLQGSETQTTLEKLDKRTIEKYQKIASERNAFIGLWLDNGILYVDISINVMQSASALNIAKLNNQLAIYDLKNSQSIYLR